jgi:hypothetical protein
MENNLIAENTDRLQEMIDNTAFLPDTVRKRLAALDANRASDIALDEKAILEEYGPMLAKYHEAIFTFPQHICDVCNLRSRAKVVTRQLVSLSYCRFVNANKDGRIHINIVN